MAKLSVVIPSRDERFLIPTIDDIFRNARGECEVVAVLDSNLWPEGWKEVTERHVNLTTIHNGGSLGMRASITRGVASAISRGATYIAKSDGHCAFSEGFDEVLKAEMDDDWIVVPRRLRLDPENWTIAEPEKPPYDYHYLSFPDDPNDFGGPGLNGKPWPERQRERADILLDEEMSSQGSFWAMKADYFQRLELMDDASYGPFWNEFQEIGLKCWLSGGRVMVNKKCHYLHLHKGTKYGRGYRLEKSALTTGRNHTMKWLYNEAWDKQTLPFKWLIDHFWPVPGWGEDWREVLYATRKPRLVGNYSGSTTDRSNSTDASAVRDGDSSDNPRSVPTSMLIDLPEAVAGSVKADDYAAGGLVIHFAAYGIGGHPTNDIDVTDRVVELIKDNSLDIVVNNSTLTPGRNPYRGKKKRLLVRYSYDGGEVVDVARDEKDWLIIGQAQRLDVHDGENPIQQMPEGFAEAESRAKSYQEAVMAQRPVLYVPDGVNTLIPTTPTALNDYLIRKFSISPQRLRAPMPIELRDFHRNDLAQLFAELGFTKGCEVGVAEANFSEVILKANPDCRLLLVDPWHAYSSNPQNKSKEKHEYAYNETLRKTAPFPNVKIDMRYSMDAVRDVADATLDWVYIDAMHSFNFVMMDLICWSGKVRSGGVIALDDFYFIDRARWGAGVVEAVQSFTSAHQISPWFTCTGHKSVEAFWVNS
jgi:hypothetical protein